MLHPINGLTLYFHPEDQETAELVRQACAKSARLMREHWGLATPQDCRIYIMTSWLDFMVRSPPWPWKLLLAVTLPLWALRAKRVWALAGGWAQRYGQRRTVGVKPPRLLQQVDRKLGDRIFVRNENLDEKVQSITCHELTHAFTSHLNLPTWLREGLAMVMVDRFFEKATVQHGTLAMMACRSDRLSAGERQKLRVRDEESLLYVYARGYWLTRYLEETRPGLLRNLLARRYRHDELERQIATAYGKGLEAFWADIDSVMVAHFERRDSAR
jgi:hypothetical protein